MARRRRSETRKQSRTVRARSPEPPIANLWLPRRPVPLPRSGRELLLVEDRRLFQPSTGPLFRTLRSTARLAVSRSRAKQSATRGSDAKRHSPFFSGVPVRIGFRNPERVLVCVRRQRRKEVLHAFRKTGKVGQKRPRRSASSSISCRR